MKIFTRNPICNLLPPLWNGIITGRLSMYSLQTSGSTLYKFNKTSIKHSPEHILITNISRRKLENRYWLKTRKSHHLIAFLKREFQFKNIMHELGMHSQSTMSARMWLGSVDKWFAYNKWLQECIAKKQSSSSR